MFDLGLAVGFLAALVAVGIGAAMSAASPVSLVVVEACCVFAIGLLVSLELLPRIVALRARRAALRGLRQQLDDLPETPHPLDSVARSRWDQPD